MYVYITYINTRYKKFFFCVLMCHQLVVSRSSSCLKLNGTTTSKKHLQNI